jgi:phosphoribosylaminoimidazole carboxylase PurK protein/phosphoribosylaminoimidazole carboxylase PurE protein
VNPTSTPAPTPGARLGIIGGGQLARMTHQAAITLGVDVAVLCDDPFAPAVRAGARHLPGRPDRFADLVRLAASVDVVTVDHEQTPAASLDRLAGLGHVVAPGALAARLGQDKAEVRSMLGAEGIPVAPWTCTADAGEVAAFGALHGWPLVVKRRCGGYDGRGVWIVEDVSAARDVIEEVGEVVVEPRLAFTHELSVLVVRSTRGEVAAYPTLETVQRQGQCDEVFVPALVAAPLAVQARALAVRVAHRVGLVGVMAVELFVVDDRLLLNELAVRPHNSGHLTVEACATSQFENHVRAVLGLPARGHQPPGPGRLHGERGRQRRRRRSAPEAGRRARRPRCERAPLREGAPAPAQARSHHGHRRRRRRGPGPGQAGPGRAAGHGGAGVSGQGSTATPASEPRGSASSWAASRTWRSCRPRPTCSPSTAWTYEVRTVSAHRTPLQMVEYAQTAAGRGLEVIIAGAGGAAHLPGMVASLTPLPVIGVPVPLGTLDGLDSLLSIVQMPAGVPVATVGIGNARNAALLAVRILSVRPPAPPEGVAEEAS